jgi:DNA-binding NtrC family response regulator
LNAREEGAATMQSRILVVDDEQGIREQLSRWLYHEGYKTELAANAKEALALVRKINFNVILLDLRLPDLNGLEVLEQLHKDYPDICVIVLTGHGENDSPAKAREAGAFDFFTKPIQFTSLIDRIDTAINQFRKERENYYQREEEKQQFQFETIIGNSEAMQLVFELVQKVAKSEETILIQGETGTGKDLLARAIHYNSARKDNPFIVADCSALAENLAESELFGHEKGAFTGANFRRIGKFERANGGTLFVNEVGVLSPNLQLKFLQFLQDGTFERLGGGEPIHVDARIIAATNVNLAEAMALKNFRQDLYSRLNRVLISVPPLRKRREDIPLLTRQFIRKFNRRNAKNIKDISPPALELLKNYHFPENVRELENIIASAILLEDGEVIKPETIRLRLIQPASNQQGDYRNLDYRAAKHIFEKAYFAQLLEQTGGNITKAARLAQWDRTHLRNKIKELGLYGDEESESSE